MWRPGAVGRPSHGRSLWDTQQALNSHFACSDWETVEKHYCAESQNPAEVFLGVL